MITLPEQNNRISSPLDVGELSARCLGRLDLVQRVLDRFQEAMDQELVQLELALLAADGSAVAGIAHRIKGTSLTVAAHGLKDCAEKLEAAAQSDGAVLEQGVAAMHEEWNRLCDMINTYSQRADQ
jgi:HPt (histidine-containing phosphotransfer) domain-containing protein